MSDLRITPGPWIAKRGAGWFVTRPEADKRREAALAVGMTPKTSLVGAPNSDDPENAECEANAKAMAAAPEMINALKPFAALAEQADRFMHEDESTCEWRIKAADLRAARAALQKAGVQ